MAVDEPRVPLHQPLKVHEVAGRQGGLWHSGERGKVKGQNGLSAAFLPSPIS